MTLYQKILKRLFDIFISITALILFFPLSFIIAVIIKLESRGPVLFIQKRVGKDGNDFSIYKFRTMVEGAENKGAGIEIEKNDSRITKIGNILRITSFDEFPQFLNILKGDMSFIGPRPTIRAQVDKYTERQKKRLNFKPGITGLAQVSGRNKLSWPERIEKDIEYIEQYSLLLDINIFFKTFFVVLFPQDIYGNDGNKGL